MLHLYDISDIEGSLYYWTMLQNENNVLERLQVDLLCRLRLLWLSKSQLGNKFSMRRFKWLFVLIET